MNARVYIKELNFIITAINGSKVNDLHCTALLDYMLADQKACAMFMS